MIATWKSKDVRYGRTMILIPGQQRPPIINFCSIKADAASCFVFSFFFSYRDHDILKTQSTHVFGSTYINSRCHSPISMPQKFLVIYFCVFYRCQCVNVQHDISDLTFYIVPSIFLLFVLSSFVNSMFFCHFDFKYFFVIGLVNIFVICPFNIFGICPFHISVTLSCQYICKFSFQCFFSHLSFQCYVSIFVKHAWKN